MYCIPYTFYKCQDSISNSERSTRGRGSELAPKKTHRRPSCDVLRPVLEDRHHVDLVRSGRLSGLEQQGGVARHDRLTWAFQLSEARFGLILRPWSTQKP